MAARSDDECRCNKPILGPEGYCQSCGQQISFEQIEKLQGEIDSEFESIATSAVPSPASSHEPNRPQAKSATAPRPAPTNNYSVNTKVSSKDAARRTLKYATLFEDIGKFVQYLNAVAAIILLILVIFFMDTPNSVRIGYGVGILALWLVSYIQTSLMRGLAAYFQMKAAAHLGN